MMCLNILVAEAKHGVCLCLCLSVSMLYAQHVHCIHVASHEIDEVQRLETLRLQGRKHAYLPCHVFRDVLHMMFLPVMLTLCAQ